MGKTTTIVPLARDEERQEEKSFELQGHGRARRARRALGPAGLRVIAKRDWGNQENPKNEETERIASTEALVGQTWDGDKSHDRT